MKQSIVHIALVVREYDEAIDFYTNKLHFTLVEDTYQPEQDKRWVVVAPHGSHAGLVLTLASTANQQGRVGDQTGGRVAFFLHTDDFARDHARLSAAGAHFEELPRHEDYGSVAVFRDLYGNRWDLIEPRA